MRRRIQLSIATWVTIIGSLATLPFCVLLVATHLWSMDRLSAEEDSLRQQEAQLVAGFLNSQFLQVRARLDIAASVVEAGGVELLHGLAARAANRTLLEVRPTSHGSPGNRTEQLSPLMFSAGVHFAELSVTVAAPGGQLHMLAARLGIADIASKLPVGAGRATLTDQKGTTVRLESDSASHVATGIRRVGYSVAVSAPGSVGVPVFDGWTVSVEGNGERLRAAQSAQKRRLLAGTALCMILSVAFLYMLARRIREQIDGVASDFGGSVLESQNSVISEVAELGGALASARAAVGERTRELERAQHDALTGLPGRELLLRQAREQLFAARETDDHGVALIYIDLDGFKAINDALGHNAGDELLQQVGSALRECVRGPDAVGRVGGDEFVVCFAAPMKLIVELAQRTSQRITEAIDRLQAGIGCSTGWAVSPPDCDLMDLLKQADEAMYASKSRRKTALVRRSRQAV